MGNRAVITASTSHNAPCIYLHWNGGRASVEAFLKSARHLSIKGADASTFDRIAELVATHFFNCKVGCNIYRQTFGQSDNNNGDNGTFLIDENLCIIGRIGDGSHREEVNAVKTAEIFHHITQRAPVFNQ